MIKSNWKRVRFRLFMGVYGLAVCYASTSIPMISCFGVVPYAYAQSLRALSKETAAQTEQAAQKGIPGAQHDLALMYETGDGLPKDLAQALFWYGKAAQSGFADSQYNLALLYHEGRGTARDYGKARFWYEKAAAQGLAHAAYNLGVFYISGQGVMPSKDIALSWFKKACDGGDNKGCAAHAVLNMGR